MNCLRRLLLLLLCLPAWGFSAEAAPGERPRIGLALSGGGARGGAHIGVLKALEELNIPIDYIAGTSMGAIVGAYYAAGYSPAEIADIVDSTNWVGAFSDSPDRSDTTMRKKELDSTFLIPYRVGFNKGSVQFALGVIEGQHLDQIFRRALAPVKYVTDFDQLGIPFRAVATDLVTGEEVVLSRGSLPTAVRASMSVPGVFAPVTLDGKILVDGGMANNLPVNVVRAMGADIVIAVDISSPLLKREDLDSMLTVTEQLTNFLTRKNTEQQIASLGPDDILLVPKLEGFSSADFMNILNVVDAGYDEVVLNEAAIRPLASPQAGPRHWQQARTDSSNEAFVVQFVEINNQSVLNDEIIRSRLDVELGQELDARKLEKSIDRVYSLDVFQSVTYDMVRRENGETGLEINAYPRQWGPNYLQFGLEISNVFSGSSAFRMGLSYTRNALNSLAGELRADLVVGREDRLEIDFYQPVDKRARWFVEPRVYWARNAFNLFDDEQYLAQLDITGPGFSVGVGHNFDTNNLLRLDYEYFRGDADVVIGDPGFLLDDNVRIGELLLTYRHDDQDSLWFPTRGWLATLGYRYAREDLGAASDYEQALLSTSYAWTFGRNSLLFNTQLGYSFHDNAPIERWFELGGFGRLSGLVPDQLAGPQLGLAALSWYRRLNEIDIFPAYAGISLEAGNVWQSKSAVSLGSLRYSGSLFIGADTPIGPVYLAYGHSDSGENTVYLYLGNPWRGHRY